MIRNRDIIVIGIQAWDIEIGSNCKNIAAEFARHNRVLYVNPPVDVTSLFRERKTEKMKKRARVRKGEEEGLLQLDKNLWNLYPDNVMFSVNFIGNKALFDTLNRINARWFFSDVRKAADFLGFEEVIVFNDSSMYLGQHVREFLNPSIYVYYMRDYLIKNHYWKRHAVRLEPRLIADADCVVNNSVLYTEYGALHNPHSYMVGQGCDTRAFDSSIQPIEIAEDTQDIPRPIIGYVGFLSSGRLDIEIIRYIAESRPGWSVVLVGPEDDTFKASPLHGMPNVHFLGLKPVEELPRYIESFDVAINPQRISVITMGNYPRKIDEYLVMGKPTVASSTKAMEYFKEYAYLGKTPEDYVELIERALEENSPALEEARRKFGRSHSWENNVKAIYDAILKATAMGVENTDTWEIPSLKEPIS